MTYNENDSEDEFHVTQLSFYRQKKCKHFYSLEPQQSVWDCAMWKNISKNRYLMGFKMGVNQMKAKKNSVWFSTGRTEQEEIY